MRRVAKLAAVAAMSAAVLAVNCPGARLPTRVIIMSPALPGSNRTAFNAYAASLTYDTVHLMTDKQLLADPVTLHNTGPLAEIQPMEDAYKADSSNMYDGVVLARIIVHPDTIAFNDSTYARYAIHGTGTVYWFVRHNRSYFVPTDTSRTVDSSTTLMQGSPHPNNWKESLARWQWSTSDEVPWVTCNKNRCCYAN